MAAKAKLTVSLIEGLAPGSADIIVWDTDIPGFGLKVTPKGRKSFFLYHRTQEGKERRPTLGQFPVLRPEAARLIARKMLGEVAGGLDPAQARRVVRKSETVADLLDRYLTDHAEVHKKASSVAEDRRQVERIIKPQLGRLKLTAVSRLDIVKFQAAIPQPTKANRALALLSKAFGLAETWDLRPANSNPVRGVPKHRERARERYLSPVEIELLFGVLDEEQAHGTTHASAIAAVRLLLLTGRRLSEILCLEWNWIDLEAGVLNLPDSKTGRLTLPLAGGAVALLKQLRETAAEDERYVLPGAKPGQRLVNLQKPWRRIRSKVGLEDVRIHDLRHTYASVAIGAGATLYDVQKLLGHTQVATTQRYAHLSLDHLRAAATRADDSFGVSRSAAQRPKLP
jgi:integrase